MPRDIREADWKVFRELRQVALERFCARTLSELADLCGASGKSNHERYLDVYQRLHLRDKELSSAFDDPRRSRMIQQLVHIYTLGLLERSELERFSADVQEVIQLLADANEVRGQKEE